MPSSSTSAPCTARQGRAARLAGVVAPVSRRALAAAAVALLLGVPAAAAPLGAQAAAGAGIPRHEPLSPAIVARSGLFTPSFPTATASGWRASAEAEYGSAVERNLNWPDAYLLDAELARVQLRVRRDFGGRAFVEAQGGAQRAFAGVSDAFFEQYHDVIGWVMEERDTRPRNVYGDRLLLRRLGVNRNAPARGTQPTDARLTAGLVHDADAQSVLSVTLPLAADAAPLGRGVATVSAIHTRRLAVGERATMQGTAGIGWAPREGALRSVQRSVLPMLAVGARARVVGAHSAYASLFYHAAPYRGTGFPELDAPELSADFGWVWRSPGGREWRLGLTEDTRRRDPGIDLVLKMSVE